MKNKGRTEKHYLYSYRERQGEDRQTKAILKKWKTREELKDITHIYIRKDKGRTEKQKPYWYMEKQIRAEKYTYIHISKKQKQYWCRGRQGKNWKTLPIFIQGKTREELKNITHIHKRKYMRRTKEYYLYP